MFSPKWVGSAGQFGGPPEDGAQSRSSSPSSPKNNDHQVERIDS